jgi:hypothetical protein
MRCVVHHRINELFIKQNTVANGQSTSMKVAPELAQSRGSLLDGLISIKLRQVCIKDPEATANGRVIGKHCASFC